MTASTVAVAESQLLGAIMLSGRHPAGVEASDFATGRNAQIYTACLELDAAGCKPDPPAVYAHLDGRVPLSELRGLTIDVTSPSNLDHWALQVGTAGRTRRLKAAGLALAHSDDPDQIAAALLEVDSARTPTNPAGTVRPVDWATFWTADDNTGDWLYPDVLARGRGHALYGRHGTGKSLFSVWLAAQLATGNEPTHVAYIDYEMSAADVRERLSDMGYGPTADLSRLHYCLYPELPPLDSAAGGQFLAAYLDDLRQKHPDSHLLVTLDTTGRAVAGEENAADTFREFHRHAGQALRQRGVTWLRLDHSGKDPARGQRGSSGKGDDVDVVWRLTAKQDGITLHCEKRRMGWVPEHVHFAQESEPLHYRQVAHTWPGGTAELAGELERLDIPVDASYPSVAAALRAAGTPKRKALILAAQRWRFERTTPENRPGTAAGTAFRKTAGTGLGTGSANQGVTCFGTGAGTGGNRSGRVTGTRVPTMWEPGSHPTQRSTPVSHLETPAPCRICGQTCRLADQDGPIHKVCAERASDTRKETTHERTDRRDSLRGTDLRTLRVQGDDRLRHPT